MLQSQDAVMADVGLLLLRARVAGGEQMRDSCRARPPVGPLRRGTAGPAPCRVARHARWHTVVVARSERGSASDRGSRMGFWAQS